MSELPGRSRIPAETPEDLFAFPSGIASGRKPRRCHRTRSPPFTGGGGSGSRRRSPATPLLQWKFDEAADSSGETGLKHRVAVGEARPTVSARRLASLIWDLRLQESGGEGKTNLGLEANGRRRQQLGRQLLDLLVICGYILFFSNGYPPHVPYSSNGNCIKLYSDNNEFRSLYAVKNYKGGTTHKLETSSSLLHSSIERATKWDTGSPKLSKDAFDLYGSLRLLKDQQSNTVSIISFLQSELELARSRVRELEAEQQSTKKKLGCFVRKIEVQKAAWKRREHEKFLSVIDAMKEDLNRERKSRKRLEIINTKLINELSEFKLSSKQLLEDYKKETKARELMEEVCNELAKEIGDDKAEVEALKIESLKNREEVEEERKMLQMAEVWREERVQMKLVDAKLTLEEKYSQLSMLQEEIETFLRSRSVNNFNVSEMNQAEALKEAVGSIEAHDIKQLLYQPPASQDIFSIFEELHPREQVNEKEIERCYGFSEKPMNICNNLMFEGNGNDEDDSGWETVSHVEEEQDSSKSPDQSEPSVNGVYLESRASISDTDVDGCGVDEKQNSEINEVFSVTKSQPRKKGSSISRFWKLSRSSNTEDSRKISFELTNGRLCNGRLSNATLSPARKSGDTGLSSPSVGNWSPPDLLNPNITQGMKGRVQWPQGSKKQSLTTKLMDASFQSQKIQLRQILEQKI